jgi:hypothetical protein
VTDGDQYGYGDPAVRAAVAESIAAERAEQRAEYSVRFDIEVDATDPADAARTVADILTGTVDGAEEPPYAPRAVYEVRGPGGDITLVDLSTGSVWPRPEPRQ